VADVELTGSASSLVSALQQASSAFVQFDAATAKVIRNQAKFNAQGEIIARTIIAIDAAGTKLSGTFREVEGAIEASVVATKAAVASLINFATTTEAAAAAETLLARAAAQVTGTITAQQAALAATAASLTAEATAAIAAADANAALVAAETNSSRAGLRRVKQKRLEAVADAASTAAIQANRAAIAANIPTVNALAAAERRRQLVFAAGAIVAGGTAQLEALKIQANAQRRISAERIAQLKAEGLADLTRQKKARAEAVKTAEAEIAARKKVEAQRVREAELILIETRKEEAAKARAFAQEIAARKKVEAQRLREATLIRQEIALEELKAKRIAQAAVLPTRRTGIDFRTISEGGKATQQQVKAFLAAEIAVKKLVTTGKVGFAEMAKAIRAADAGTLQLARDTTIAQQAALRLAGATNQVAAGAKKAAASTRGLSASLVGLGKLVGISLLIGSVFRLQQAFVDAFKAAGEFSIKIAEIETITTNNELSTERWAEELRKLSSAFGIDVLKQAEGAYQILSNQVAQGTEAILLLEIANRLAVTSVTDSSY